MGFFYEKQGTSKYIVYEFEENEAVDSLSLCMLKNNKIEGLVPLIYSQADNRRFIKYDISAKISLKQFFIETINKEQLLKVIKNIISVLLTAEEYMLNIDFLLLKEEYIFVDASECMVYMIYLPSEKTVENIEKTEIFFKRIIFEAYYDQRESCDYIAELISYLNRKKHGFLISEFKALIESLMNNTDVNCLSVRSAENNAVLKKLTDNEAAMTSDCFFTSENSVLSNNSDISSNWQTDTETAILQSEDIMTFKYLITHYSKENLIKFIRQYKKIKRHYGNI